MTKTVRGHMESIDVEPPGEFHFVVECYAGTIAPHLLGAPMLVSLERVQEATLEQDDDGCVLVGLALVGAPVTVCPCGCGWHDDSGQSSSVMARAASCAHDGATPFAPGWWRCAHCGHWLLTADAARRARVRLPHALYQISGEGER